MSEVGSNSSMKRVLITVVYVVFAVFGAFMFVQQISVHKHNNNYSQRKLLQSSAEHGIPRELSVFHPSYEPTFAPTTHQPTNMEVDIKTQTLINHNFPALTTKSTPALVNRTLRIPLQLILASRPERPRLQKESSHSTLPPRRV